MFGMMRSSSFGDFFCHFRKPVSFQPASTLASVGCTGTSWVTFVLVAFSTFALESHEIRRRDAPQRLHVPLVVTPAQRRDLASPEPATVIVEGSLFAVGVLVYAL